jgi:mRNA interferase RelE/StbE
MASYHLKVKRSFEKDLRKCPDHVVKRVLRKVEQLPEQPLPKGVDKIEGSESSYRIRVGDYRVIYELNQGAKEITVFYVRHRKDVYRRL